MAINFEVVKKHPAIVAGSAIAVFLLVYLYERSKSAGGSAAPSSDLSGGANQVQALSAAADLTNAQTNAQVEVAAYKAGVQNNQVAAQLQSDLAKTAAELAATNKQTSAAEAVALAGTAAGVTVAEINAQSAIIQDQIKAGVIEKLSSNSVQLAKVYTSVPLAQIKEQEQIYGTLAMSGKLGGDSTGVAQVVSSVYGRGPEAIAANQPAAVSSSPGTILEGIGRIAAGLFG